MHTALVAFMCTLNRFLLYQWTDGILTHSISLEYIHITFNSHPDFGQKMKQGAQSFLRSQKTLTQKRNFWGISFK